MGIICGKCTKCLDLWLADTAGGFPPSRRCVFILLHPGLYYSSEEPMNILKANRAINPSKINLSEEMLHFYFRAQSRPRHGLRPRSALRAVPAGAGSVSPPRGRGVPPRQTRVRAAPNPPRRSTELMDIVKGLLRSRVPVGNAIFSQMRAKQSFPEQGVEMPRFCRFRSAWGHPPATSRQPPALPRPAELRSLLRGKRTALLLQISQFSIPTVSPREAREDEEGGEPCPEPRSEPTEEN